MPAGAVPRFSSGLGVSLRETPIVDLGVLTPHSNHKLQKRFGPWSLWLGVVDRFRTRALSLAGTESLTTPFE